MFTVSFVTDEFPVVIYKGMPPPYVSDGLAIDCASIVHVLNGTSQVSCNLETITEHKDSVILFNPGDIVKVEYRSEDFEAEILAFSRFIHLSVLNQLEDVHINALKRNFVFNYEEISSAATGLFNLLRPAINISSAREIYNISVMQLRAFFTLCQVTLNHYGITTDTFKTRSDAVFFRFRQLLSEYYKVSRNVRFYAEKLCITTRYLTNVVQSHYGHSPKAAIDIYTVMQLRLDLLQSDISLSELAESYHFSSLSFFCEYFHRNAGITPQEYRKQHSSN